MAAPFAIRATPVRSTPGGGSSRYGWIKQAAGLRQLMARGRFRVVALFRLHVVAYNLIRLANLLAPREAMA